MEVDRRQLQRKQQTRDVRPPPEPARPRRSSASERLHPGPIRERRAGCRRLPRTLDRGPRGPPELHTPEAPAVTGWLRREARLAGARPRRRSGRAVAPLGPHPGGTPGQGTGWGGSRRAAAVSAAAAKLRSPEAPLGGSSQAWREEAGPGSSARGSAPARGSLPGARRGGGQRGGAPCRAPGKVRGVCPRPRPAPTCPPAAESPRGPLPERSSPPSDLRAFSERSSRVVEAIEAGPCLLHLDLFVESGAHSQQSRWNDKLGPDGATSQPQGKHLSSSAKASGREKLTSTPLDRIG
nr:basic salivary proline-rich protein 3-like [Manis javanica]